MFNGFFYHKMTTNRDKRQSTNKEEMYDRIRTWTRRLDLFNNDFVFVPVNESLHWFLAVICYPARLLKLAEMSE